MAAKRSTGGFVRATDIDLKDIGLSKARVKSLRLESAWHRVAGRAVVERAIPVCVNRGVLHIRVVDPGWMEAIREMVPNLAGRMSAACPDLKIRKFRILSADGEPVVKAGEPVRQENGEDDSEKMADDGRGEISGKGEPDLGRLKDRYLKSTARRRPEGT